MPLPKRKPVKKKKPKKIVRTDWKTNSVLISKKYIQLTLKNKKRPTYEDVARALGLNVITVKRHAASDEFKDRLEWYREHLSDAVIVNLYKHASKGDNDRMIRIFAELFLGLGEKKKVEITGKDGAPLYKVYNGIDDSKV